MKEDFSKIIFMAMENKKLIVMSLKEFMNMGRKSKVKKYGLWKK